MIYLLYYFSIFINQIVAKELGVNELSATASVTVNLIDENDNQPTFTKFPPGKGHYEATVHEEASPGTVVLQVRIAVVCGNFS